MVGHPEMPRAEGQELHCRIPGLPRTYLQAEPPGTR